MKSSVFSCDNIIIIIIIKGLRFETQIIGKFVKVLNDHFFFSQRLHIYMVKINKKAFLTVLYVYKHIHYRSN
jgi:hypothetical protein